MFAGPAVIKALLLQHEDGFARNLTQEMLAYPPGRGLERYDDSTVQKITDAVKMSGYRSNALILGRVESYPFRLRKG